MKYVAFLDILGFKQKLKSLSHEGAKEYIGSFSTTVYQIFQTEDRMLVNGYIVSDSIILYTNDAGKAGLIELVKLVKDICREEFSKHGILIRGAIAKGDFDRVPAVELPKLQKQLIVGEAYVEAYRLEDSFKNIGINLAKEVYEDLIDTGVIVDVFDEKIGDKQHYIFRYMTADFLLNIDNMRRFVELAKEAEWLPHYYNAIYFALKRETNDKKVEQIFVNIEELVCDNVPNEKWRELDVFIKNSFNENVINDFKIRFLKHIRRNLFKMR